MSIVDGSKVSAEKSGVKIYGKPNCPWCKETKEKFEEMGVGYEYVDLYDEYGQEGAGEIVKQEWGVDYLPVVTVNDDFQWAGLRLPRVRKLAEGIIDVHSSESDEMWEF